MEALSRDYFSDPELVRDPYPFFEAARKQGPLWREPVHGVIIVTGHDEIIEVLSRNDGTFSSAASVIGPIPPLPFPIEGEDISSALEAHRDEMPWSVHLTSLDGDKHKEQRALLMPLLSFKRLKANEEYLTVLADRVIDSFFANGSSDVARDYAHAVATFAISDLLGIPEEDRSVLVELLGAPPSQIEGDAAHRVGADPLIFLKERFDGYLRERQTNPGTDLMSELMQSRYKDGSEPDFDTLSNLARFMFGAGQDTTSRLVAMTVRVLGDDPALQARVRAEPECIPTLLEEVLRWDGPVKMVYRLAVRRTVVAGMEVQAGTLVGLALSAGSNDPAYFDQPRAFDIDRPNLRNHLAFSRGVHGCMGAPLARIEARVAIERLLARTQDIRISEAHHGPRDARRYRYEPTYSFRSLSELHVELTPVSSVAESAKNLPMSSATPA